MTSHAKSVTGSQYRLPHGQILSRNSLPPDHPLCSAEDSISQLRQQANSLAQVHSSLRAGKVQGVSSLQPLCTKDKLSKTMYVSHGLDPTMNKQGAVPWHC